MPSSRPKPLCLKPPNGVDGAHRRVRVDREHARLDRARDAQRAAAVARPDRAREPVVGVVRDPDRLGLVGERDQRRDRAEDLLARDPVVRPRLDERRRDTRSPCRPAPRRGRAARPRRSSRPSRGAAAEIERPHLGRVVLRVADLQRRASPRRAARRSGRRRSRSTRMRERAQQSWPALSNTAYGAAAAARSRSASAKTTFADLPPSSSVTRLIVPAAPRITCCPTSVEPVKPIFATSGMLDQPLPDDRALADDDVDDALGDARLERELAEPQRRERRQLGRLEHDGVAAGERRPELPRGDVEREVPRRRSGPTTPSGSRNVRSTPPATGIVSPKCLSTAPA